MEQQLVRYDTMRNAIAECHAIDEVKDMRDKMLALETYARQANDTELERQVHDIRVRAERRAGELLRHTPKAKGAPGNQYTGPVDRDDGSKTLRGMGISRDQSSLWQKLAAVPDEEFEVSLSNPVALPTAANIVHDHETRNAPPTEETVPVDPDALWLWGRLLDFKRRGLLDRNPAEIRDTMLDHMIETTDELVPIVIKWLKGTQNVPATRSGGRSPS